MQPADDHDSDQLRNEPSRRWQFWTVVRWGFLVFNVAVVSGWVFWLMWTGQGDPWAAWAVRSLISVQVAVALTNLLLAYRQCALEGGNRAVLGEAWVYLALAMASCFTLGLSMVS